VGGGYGETGADPGYVDIVDGGDITDGYVGEYWNEWR